jgi:hypothetical protein
MDKSTPIMRLETVILDVNIPLGKKSKVALRMANPDGTVDKKHKISGLLYFSQGRKQTEQITFAKYQELGMPDYISRISDGTLRAVPPCLIPADFPELSFD